jgi:hypothetical protein
VRFDLATHNTSLESKREFAPFALDVVWACGAEQKKPPRCFADRVSSTPLFSKTSRRLFLRATVGGSQETDPSSHGSAIL